jgi:hypothetical protein
MHSRHRLENLAIARKQLVLAEIPDFDLYALGRILKVAAEWQEAKGEGRQLIAWLTGECASPDGSRLYQLTLRFEGVRQLKLPAIIDHGLWLSELEVEDVAQDQLEGVSFRVENHGTQEFLVLCRGIEVASFHAASSVGGERGSELDQ